MRECKRQGCGVHPANGRKTSRRGLATRKPRRNLLPSRRNSVADIVQAVSHLARGKKSDRIVALDEFDMETAATLREHLRIPGMGLTTMRYFRDKLAMRMRALDRACPSPGFCAGRESRGYPLLPRSCTRAVGSQAAAGSVSHRNQEDRCALTNCGRFSNSWETSNPPTFWKSFFQETCTTWIRLCRKMKSFLRTSANTASRP